MDSGTLLLIFEFWPVTYQLCDFVQVTYHSVPPIFLIHRRRVIIIPSTKDYCEHKTLCINHIHQCKTSRCLYGPSDFLALLYVIDTECFMLTIILYTRYYYYPSFMDEVSIKKLKMKEMNQCNLER